MKKLLLILLIGFAIACESGETIPVLDHPTAIELEIKNKDGNLEEVVIRVSEENGTVQFESPQIKLESTRNNDSNEMGTFIGLSREDIRSQANGECEPDIRDGWHYSPSTNCLIYGTMWFFSDCTSWFVPGGMIPTNIKCGIIQV